MSVFDFSGSMRIFVLGHPWKLCPRSTKYFAAQKSFPVLHLHEWWPLIPASAQILVTSSELCVVCRGFHTGLRIMLHGLRRGNWDAGLDALVCLTFNCFFTSLWQWQFRSGWRPGNDLAWIWRIGETGKVNMVEVRISLRSKRWGKESGQCYGRAIDKGT